MDNSKRIKKIFLISISISTCSLLFFLSLGRDVEFVTGGLWSSIGNLLGVVTLFSQFILHFLLLLIIDYLYKIISKKEEQPTAILWMYFILALVINVIAILNATKPSRNQLQIQDKWNETEKYNWEEAISCPEGYPVIVLNGRFKIALWSKNNVGNGIDHKLYDEKWSLEDKTSRSEFNLKNVMPDSLNLLWYSVLEKSYYKIDVALNKKEITKLFREGFLVKNHNGIFHKTFGLIVAGLAPGGDVAVWTRDNWGKSVEVGFYKAQKIDSSEIHKYVSEYDRKECMDNLEKVSLNSKKEWVKSLNLKKISIPYGIWREKYRQKYNWRFQSQLASKLDRSDIEINLFNGEKFTLVDDTLSQKENSLQALPSEIKLSYISEGKTQRIWVNFDEDNIYETFKILSNGNDNLPIIIECIVNKQGKIETVNAKNEFKTIQLKVLID